MNFGLVSKSTSKNPTDLTKKNVVIVYNALSNASNSEEREQELRRLIQFPSEYETVFANLIHDINKIFTHHGNECHSTSYKNNSCYKKLKSVLNEYQETLSNHDIPAFTVKRAQPSITSKHTRTPTPKTMRTQHFDGPTPLLPSPKTSIYDMTDMKLKYFVDKFIAATDQREFIEKYISVLDEDNNPFPGMVDDIYTEMSSDENNSTNIFNNLKDIVQKQKKFGELKIYILYPIREFYTVPNRRNPNIRNLGGGKKQKQTKRKTKRKLTKRRMFK